MEFSPYVNKKNWSKSKMPCIIEECHFVTTAKRIFPRSSGQTGPVFAAFAGGMLKSVKIAAFILLDLSGTAGKLSTRASGKRKDPIFAIISLLEKARAQGGQREKNPMRPDQSLMLFLTMNE